MGEGGSASFNLGGAGSGESPGHDPTLVNEGFEVVLAQTDHTPEPVGSQLAGIDEAVQRPWRDA